MILVPRLCWSQEVAAVGGVGVGDVGRKESGEEGSWLRAALIAGFFLLAADAKIVEVVRSAHQADYPWVKTVMFFYLPQSVLHIPSWGPLFFRTPSSPSQSTVVTSR